MKKTKVTARVLVMILIMAMSMASVVYAAEPKEQGEEVLIENLMTPNANLDYEQMMQPRINGFLCSMAFNQISSTRAEAGVMASVGPVIDKITSSITLQMYSGGSYVNTGTTTAKKTVYNDSGISHGATFKIANGRKYRIKVTLTGVDDGVVTTSVFYKSMVAM